VRKKRRLKGRKMKEIMKHSLLLTSLRDLFHISFTISLTFSIDDDDNNNGQEEEEEEDSIIVSIDAFDTDTA
jgi:hypothetical protein